MKSIVPDDDARPEGDVLDESPILSAFKVYAVELTERHDKHERLIRISRDITTESKRIIFYLHSLKDGYEHSALDSAKKRIDALTTGLLKKAAAELYVKNYPYIPVTRVIIPALEELSEAYCFLQFLYAHSNFQIPSWKNLQEIINYEKSEGENVKLFLQINPLEFMLGVMDFTGELMRMCINKASSDDVKSCNTLCSLLQQIYMRFLGMNYNKDVNKKMSTLKQSVQKVEYASYKLKLRSLE